MKPGRHVGEIQRVTVTTRLTPELFKQLKLQAAVEDLFISGVIEKALEMYMKEHPVTIKI